LPNNGNSTSAQPERKHDACPGDEHRARAEPPEEVGAQGAPERDRERNDQQAGEVRADPVVDPGAAGGDGAEV
jgi:hypothetical protein